MFDDDNTLAYEPESTAAIILTGGDEEAEAAAIEVTPPQHQIFPFLTGAQLSLDRS